MQQAQQPSAVENTQPAQTIQTAQEAEPVTQNNNDDERATLAQQLSAARYDVNNKDAQMSKVMNVVINTLYSNNGELPDDLKVKMPNITYADILKSNHKFIGFALGFKNDDLKQAFVNLVNQNQRNPITRYNELSAN